MTDRINWRASHDKLREAQAPLLDQQLSSLWQRSPFLAGIWRTKAGFDRAPKASELTRVPLVTKDDLRLALAEGSLGRHLACDPMEVAHIHATSGTSGRPTYFGLTARDHDAWLEIFVRGFSLGGARRGDRVLHAFAMARGYAGGVPMVAGFQRMGCTVLAMGAEAGSSRISDALERLQPTVVYASPSMLRRLAPIYEEETGRSAATTAVRSVITGGEPGAGDPASKRALEELWGANVREAGGGSDICPLMWAECEAQAGLHFVAGDEVLFEIIDPDTGEELSVEDGVEGEIVYTHLRRDANPLVRMRHADIVEMTTSGCDCGLAAPRIRFRGRSDEMVIVRGVKVFPSAVQAVVSQFVPPLTGRVAIHRPGGDGDEAGLQISCEWVDGGDETAQRQRLETRARDALGVRVSCRLVPVGALGDSGQKATWIVREAEEGMP